MESRFKYGAVPVFIKKQMSLFAKMDAKKLVAEFNKAMHMTVEGISLSAAALRTLDQKNYPLPNVDDVAIDYLRAVANGAIHPKALFAMGDRPKMLGFVMKLSTDAQAEVVEGKKIPVRVRRHDGSTHIVNKTIDEMTLQEAGRVFVDGKILTPKAQLGPFSRQTILPSLYIRVVPGGIVVKGLFISVDDMRRYVEEASKKAAS